MSIPDEYQNIPDEVQRIIDSSGNTFHSKVARWFSENGWQIRVSPYYMDQSQNKAREIDLIAEKAYKVQDLGGNWIRDVIVRLFIECKYVASHAVFWFSDKDMTLASSLVCSQGIFEENNFYTKDHHYLNAYSIEVAKLFASKSNNSQDNEIFYKVLNQVLNAQTAMDEQSPFIPKHELHSPGKEQVFNYPVVVCNTFQKIYEQGFYDDRDTKRVDKNFQLEVQYAYTDRSGRQQDNYFLVDFVEYEQLAKFHTAIDEDVKIATSFIRKKIKSPHS